DVYKRQMFFQFLSEKEGNLDEVDELFVKLTGAELKGQIIPVSVELSNVCLKTISGKEYIGENYVDDLRMSDDKIVEIWLEPEVQSNKKAIEALNRSEVIILCPGTTYGSILPNFLPKGMAESYRTSKAKKILMTNILATANEIEDVTQRGYVEIFKKYLKTDSPFDLILMADVASLDKDLFNKALSYYKLEHANLVEKIENYSIKTVMADVAIIEEKNMRLRHSEEKLGRLFRTLEF
ncbi:MAG: 2-phospho-L-lactate transferase CofD family protein, partial [Candidatus Shapirobacteria bacterium]|nr:2-phospho-L-lactate transferase CofD family protein [Candidatus Shapirobacteria bacterium]